MAKTMKTWTIEATVMPGRGVNDPQGDAVLAGLKQLGFEETERVRVGKMIRMDIVADDEEDARAAGERMCEQLLANPVIEEYEVVVRETTAK